MLAERDRKIEDLTCRVADLEKRIPPDKLEPGFQRRKLAMKAR